MSTLSVSAIQNPAAGQPNILLNADGSVTLPVITGAAAPLQFQAGTLWFDTAGPALQIRNPANTAWVALSSAQAATLAEAAAGTLNTVYSSPLTSVPKDAAGMTGAALLPTGTNAQRAAIASPVAGMTRFNTDYTPDSLEVYNGTDWRQVAYVPNPTLPPDLTISANTTLTDSTYVVNNLTINAGVTATLSSQSVVFICYGDVNIAGTIDANGTGPVGGRARASQSGQLVSGVAGGNIGSALGTSLDPFGPPPYQPSTSVVGSGGTGGFVSSAGGEGENVGGNGGGGILIFSQKSITVTGTLTARGGSGSIIINTAPVEMCGAGGGSGGGVILHAIGNITFSGTIDVSGGNGGNGVLNGVGSGANGGGGGGGGYVILEADTTLTNTGTITLTGGAAGATAGTVDQLGGGTGASFGGRGGRFFGAPGPGPGAAGVFATAGSPI